MGSGADIVYLANGPNRSGGGPSATTATARVVRRQGHIECDKSYDRLLDVIARSYSPALRRTSGLAHTFHDASADCWETCVWRSDDNHTRWTGNLVPDTSLTA